MPPPPSRATPLPPDERRAAIVAAAIPLVREHGAAVTTREIAEAAGIAEGTIFRVFPDKDAVITAVVKAVLDPTPFVHELRLIDPFTTLEQVLTQAVDAMRRRIDSVWQIMWMLRVSGPPGREQDTSGFVVVSDSGTPIARSAPDLTEANQVLAGLLAPHGDALRLEPAEAARMFRVLTFASAHPRITDGHPLSTAEIVDLLLHGIGAVQLGASKTATADSGRGPDSTSDRHPGHSAAQPVGAP